MKNFVCWDSDDVYHVINPDADAVPAHVFRAIHTDFAVRKRDQLDDEGRYVQPEEVLGAFLAPKDHALVPVIGDSGTGKSHLIRWLQMRLGRSDKREVIFVPKAGTNLRGIVKSLIETLPAEAREPYVAVLKDAGGMMLNTEAQRTAVLSQVQLALVNDPGSNQTGMAKEQEDFLLDGLQSLFLDPYVRDQHFMRDGRFAADIAAHVFLSPKNYAPTDRRREFSRSDLPLAISSITKAAQSTRDFLPALVADSALADAAVQIINRNLDWAIANCLNVTGDRLIELMLDIRRHIKRSGKELILLIEDFARLQGLDRALLQSLLEQRADLCRLRTAFATTTGFFDSIAPTVRTRLSFVVDLDVPLTGSTGVPLPRIVARYMNALRWGDVRLHAQWERAREGDNEFEVDSACADCEHRSACHASFGEVDGMGLYPFTAEAIQIMAERADEEAHHRFKLRTFQRRVLRPVALLANELSGGHFPPFTLLADLGGLKHFPATEENRLRQLDPSGWRRREALLQLWKDASAVRDLDEGIHEAFGLRRLGVLEQGEPPPPATLRSGTAETIEMATPPSDARLQELERWQRGQASLSTPTAQSLRDLVFEAIRGFIDWDSVGLALSGSTGASRPFQPRSIYFQKQVTTRGAATISLTIPGNWDDETERYQTLLALQGLLQLKKVGSWSFKDGAEKLAALHGRLKAWATLVERDLRALDLAEAEWDPACTAFELRVILVALTQPDIAIRANLEIARAGHAELKYPSLPNYANPKLVSIVSDLASHDADLRSVMANRSLTMKGGAIAKTLIDAERYLQLASLLRHRSFILGGPLPKETSVRTEELRTLVRLGRRVSSELPAVLEDEIAQRRQWQELMDATFGSHSNQVSILEDVQLYLDAAGPFAIRGTQELVAARASFTTCAYDPAIKSVRQMSSERPRLTDVATNVADVMSSSRKLLQTLSAAVDSGERELKGRLQDAGIDPDAQHQVKEDIAADLEQVVSTLQGLANADAS